ncbi:hypothetical protein KSP39_PZI013025 [Platanthera zijinensis]|uniref:SET and MYND domain-containing protein 4 n=1 Tax=Platanthera zijinensis TaxID=2320716 RepID=A0AAP0BG93_9ASPA
MSRVCWLTLLMEVVLNWNLHFVKLLYAALGVVIEATLASFPRQLLEVIARRIEKLKVGLVGGECFRLLHLVRGTPLGGLKQMQTEDQLKTWLVYGQSSLCCDSGIITVLKLLGNKSLSQEIFEESIHFYRESIDPHLDPTSLHYSNPSIVLFKGRSSDCHRTKYLRMHIWSCNYPLAIDTTLAKRKRDKIPSLITPIGQSFLHPWWRRRKKRISRTNYPTNIRNVEVMMILEPSFVGPLWTRSQLDLLFLTTNIALPILLNIIGSVTEAPCDIKLHCISTPDKGRGMISSNDISPASLIHLEEPFAAIIMKSCRETHCHFCFNELPADTLFCNSCTIPLYCSEHCREQAVGCQFVRIGRFSIMQNNLSEELWKHVNESIPKDRSACANVCNQPEHTHECGGSHWSAVLPTDVVLAGRVLMKSMENRKVGLEFSKHIETLDFAHNYNQVPPDHKVEMHLYALVLAFCLRQHFPSLHVFISKLVTSNVFLNICLYLHLLVLLISQIRVNSMAVVHMKSVDEPNLFIKSSDFSPIRKAFTSTVEQVRVGLAIYSMGSLFNHSCKPNLHAYFLSRTLHLRCTELVPAKCPLELSYGPQVGQQDLQGRQEILQDQYSFKCCCVVCSELNLSDLVINSFRCPKSNCLGAILGNASYQKHEDNSLLVTSPSYSGKLSIPVCKGYPYCKANIREVAYSLLEKVNLQEIGPGYCLSCLTFLDLASTTNYSSRLIDIDRLKGLIVSSPGKHCLISNILKSLDDLKLVRHPYSKVVSQAEDSVGEAFAMIGQLEPARQHCQESIKILERLYHTNHIAVAHEWMKLASIQLSLGNHADALYGVMRAETIFSLYYGFHVAKIFTFVEDLKKEARRIQLGGVSM